MTTVYTMFSFQNAIDASDELCTMISQHKNTGVRSFLLTHARRSGPRKRSKGRRSSLLKHRFTFPPLIIISVFLHDKMISSPIAFSSFSSATYFMARFNDVTRKEVALNHPDKHAITLRILRTPS